MQRVTSSRNVEGQDLVESIHPAPSSDLLRKKTDRSKEVEDVGTPRSSVARLTSLYL